MTRLHANRRCSVPSDDALVVQRPSVAHDGTVLKQGDTVFPLAFANGVRGRQQLVLYRGRELRFLAAWGDS